MHSLITHARSLVSGIDLQIGSQKERKREKEREREREREYMEARPRPKEEIGERIWARVFSFFLEELVEKSAMARSLSREQTERPNELGSLSSR